MVASEKLMQTTALASGSPECPSNDRLIMHTKNCAKQWEILENAEAHARTVWLHERLPGWWCIPDTQGFRQNSHTRLPNYCASPKEKNQHYISQHKVNSRILQTLNWVTYVHFPRLFIFCNAKFHPAVHGKPSVAVALFMKHIAFFSLIRTPGVVSCSSASFVCVTLSYYRALST